MIAVSGWLNVGETVSIILIFVTLAGLERQAKSKKSSFQKKRTTVTLSTNLAIFG